MTEDMLKSFDIRDKFPDIPNEETVGILKDAKGKLYFDYRIFVEYILGRFTMFVCAKDDRLYIFTNKGVYVQIDESSFKSILHNILEGVNKYFWRLDIEKEYVGKIRRTIRKNVELNDRDIMVLKNGYYRLSTNKFTPKFSSKIYSTILLPINYDENAKAPVFLNFITDIMGASKFKKEEIECRSEFLLDVLAYLIARNNKMQRIHIFLGEGANGKSTLINLLELVIGEDNISHTSLADLGSTFGLSSIYDKVINLDNDAVAKGKSINTDIIKKITGGDKVEVNIKNVKQFSAEINANILVASNNLIKVDDASYGFARRPVVIDFNKTYITLEEYNNKKVTADNMDDYGIIDTELGDKLKAELDGIFMILLKRLEILVKNKFVLNEPESIKAEKYKFIKSNNNVMEFFDEEIVFDEKAKDIKKSEIYRAYIVWLSNSYSDSDKVQNQEFWKRLKNIFEKKGFNLQEHTKKKRGNDYIFGLKLKSNDVEEDEIEIEMDME